MRDDIGMYPATVLFGEVEADGEAAGVAVGIEVGDHGNSG